MDEVRGYLFYLVWVCGVPLHWRYAAALVASTDAGASLSQAAEDEDEDEDELLARSWRQQQHHHHHGSADARPAPPPTPARLQAAVRGDIFPHILCCAKSVDAAVAQHMPLAAAISGGGCGSPAAVVALAIRSEPAADGGSVTGVVCLAPSDGGPAEVLALGPCRGGEWAAAVLAAALAQAAALERRLGSPAGAPARLVPASTAGTRPPRAVEDSVVVDADTLTQTQSQSQTSPLRLSADAPPRGSRRLEYYFGGQAQVACPPPAGGKVVDAEVVVISDEDSD